MLVKFNPSQLRLLYLTLPASELNRGFLSIYLCFTELKTRQEQRPQNFFKFFNFVPGFHDVEVFLLGSVRQGHGFTLGPGLPIRTTSKT